MYNMKNNILISISFILLAGLSFCNNESRIKDNDKQHSYADSIWLEFAKALELKNTVFLINNSLDTVSCFDCNIDINNEKNYFESEFIFKNHIDKIMHLKSLTDKEYSISQVSEKIIKVVYNVKASKAPEGAYSLIFTLVKSKGRYYFKGMMVQ